MWGGDPKGVLADLTLPLCREACAAAAAQGVSNHREHSDDRRPLMRPHRRQVDQLARQRGVQ